MIIDTRWQEEVGEALDEASLEWLHAELPRLAERVERAVALGAGPEEMRRFVFQHTGRMELAQRCEQAVRAARRKGES